MVVEANYYVLKEGLLMFMQSGIMVNYGSFVRELEAVHLGHTGSYDDHECITLAAKGNFCCSFYGSLLWYTSGAAVQSLCVDWWKSLRSLWCVQPISH